MDHAAVRAMRVFALLLPAALWAQNTQIGWNFEYGYAGWYTGSNPANAGYQFAVAYGDCPQGRQCVAITAPPSPPSGAYGVMTYTTPVAPFKGKTVRVRAAMRIADSSSRAYVWLSGWRNSTNVAYGNATPSGAAWQYVSADVPVPSDADNLTFGFVLQTGKAWVDDITVTALSPSPREAPRQITERGISNLSAFTRLLGAVRFFHPSDQVAALDWDQFTVQGIRAVEDAATPAELAARLQSFFSPFAPTLRVYAGATPALPAELTPASKAGLKAVRWDNYGVGLGVNSGTYTSARAYAAADAALPSEFVDPASPYVMDLGQGVFARVPLTLYADDGGTLPHASPVAPTLEGQTAEDRATRLAAVAVAWSVAQNFYPYFDVVDTDWPAALNTALSSASTDDGEPAFKATLERLVAALKDGHGWVGAPSDGPIYMAPINWDWIENQVIITYVKDAQGQNVSLGDRVISVDGRPVNDVIAERRERVSAATPQYLLYLSVHHAAICGSSHQMDLEIEPYSNPGARRTVHYACSTNLDWGEPRGDAVRDLGNGVMYVDWNIVTAAQFTAALPKLAAATGLIFDMRGYPQTFLPLSYLSATPLFSEKFYIPTPAKPDRTEFTFHYSNSSAAVYAPTLTAPKVYLTDKRAVSAAETIGGIVEAYKLAEIVGGPTAGTNGDVNIYRLPGRFQTRFTGLKVLKHDGSQHHGVGIQPTVPVVRTRQAVANGVDEVMARALEVLKWPAPGATPLLTAAGIVNGANFNGGAVAPGEIVSLFGLEIGPAKPVSAAYDISNHLPLSVADVKVFFDDIPSPLIYASNGQVNAIVPYGLKASSTKARVEVQGRRSLEVSLPVAAAAPGIFNGITNQNGGYNSPAQPAARGEIITLYATGVGQTTPAGVDGLLPQSGKWPAAAANLAVSFAGAPGTVLFQGHTYAGVLQVNVRVPQNAPTGDRIPVILTVNGASSGADRTVALQ